MHKGKPYPRAWRYWGTNFLFWPNLAPNRYVIGLAADLGDSWSVLPNYSTPMRTSRSAYLFGGSVMEYRFHHPANTDFGRILLMDTATTPGAPGLARVFLSLAGAGRAKAELEIPFMGGADISAVYNVTILDLPFDCPTLTVNLYIRPANWDEDPRGGDKP